MTESERIEMMNEARQFYLAGPVIMPLLEKRKKIAFEKLMGRYRDGDQNYSNLIAELAVLDNLTRDIKQQEQTYITLENQNGSNDRN